MRCVPAHTSPGALIRVQPLELEAQVLISASTRRRLCLQALGKLRHEREPAEEGERQPKDGWMKPCAVALVQKEPPLISAAEK